MRLEHDTYYALDPLIENWTLIPMKEPLAELDAN